MAGLGYAAAIVLGVVLGLAAVTKLADRPGTARSFVAFGLPRSLAAVVPVVELAVAGALLVAPAWGAAAALPLLALFTTFLARAIRRGVTAPCNCFGGAGRMPVSGVDLARNVALLAAGVAALFAPRPRVPGAGAALVVGAIAAAVVLALRRVGHEGPRLGRRAPPLDGVTWPSVVAFTSPGCPRCELDRPALEARRAHVVELSPATAGTFAAWRVRATPYYVEVDAAGVVRGRGPELSELHSAT